MFVRILEGHKRTFKDFDENTAKRLLEEKEIEELHGFFGRNGEGYSNSITLTIEEKWNQEMVGKQNPVEVMMKNYVFVRHVNKGFSIRINSTMYACDDEECKFRGLSHDMCKADFKRRSKGYIHQKNEIRITG